MFKIFSRYYHIPFADINVHMALRNKDLLSQRWDTRASIILLRLILRGDPTRIFKQLETEATSAEHESMAYWCFPSRQLSANNQKNKCYQ